MKSIKIVASIFIFLALAVFIKISLSPIICNFSRDESNLQSLQTALKLFYLDTNRFPTNQEGLEILVKKRSESTIVGYKQNGYLDMLVKDHWGVPYHYLVYRRKSGEESVVVWTYGSDETPGGEGERADIYRTLQPSTMLIEAQ